MIGKGSQGHNNRTFFAENVNSELSKNNMQYCDEDLKQVYHNLFGEALQKYNDKQTRKDRKIDNYYEHIRTSKQEKLFYEVIFQVGNSEDTHIGSKESELAKTILDQFMKEFQQRNPNLHVFSAHLHMDEATPHLHIDFVPFTTGSKRGLETRVSLKQALKEQGFEGGSRSETEWNQWVNAEKEQLADVMLENGIEWKQLGTHNEHLSVLDYKKQERQKEIAELDKTLEKAKKKHIDLDYIQQINASNTIFGNKVTISNKDYQYLKNCAQKYVVEEKKTIQLQKELRIVHKTIDNQEKQIQTFEQQINDFRIDRVHERSNAQKLEKDNRRLETFIDKQGLRETYMDTIKQSKKQRGMER